MWTLILTIIMASSNSSSFSEIKTIQNFEIKQLCEAAGNQWYKDVSEKLKPYTEGYLGRQYTYTCVKVK